MLYDFLFYVSAPLGVHQNKSIKLNVSSVIAQRKVAIGCDIFTSAKEVMIDPCLLVCLLTTLWMDLCETLSRGGLCCKGC